MSGDCKVTLEKLPPNNSRSYVGADFVELLAMFSIDREVSRSDVLQWVARGKDTGAFEEDPETLATTNAQETRVDDWFRHIEYRIKIFADSYPFRLTHDRNTLSFISGMSPKNKIYIFMLAASNLWAVDRSCRTRLTGIFEVLSKEALKIYLPQNAEVFLFGKGASNSDSPFTGTNVEKLQTLAEFIHEDLVCEPSNFMPHDSGDSGLDVVGWIPFGDEVPGTAVFFGQCACGLEWNEKQGTVTRDHWRTYLTAKNLMSGMLFCSRLLRDSNGSWYEPHKIKTIVIDRLRIAKLFDRRWPEEKEMVSVYEMVDLFMSPDNILPLAAITNTVFFAQN
jgi:hypothetical protein